MQKDDTTTPEDPVEDAEVLELEPEDTTTEISDQTRDLAAAQAALAEPAEVTYAREFGPPSEDHAQRLALLNLVDNALSNEQPIEVIERLLAVHERYEAGLARKAYSAAVSALRADLPDIVKTETVDYKAKGGRVTYEHENLANMVEDLSPPMARHGLSFRWRIEQDTTELIKVTCIVTHADGYGEEATLSGPPDRTGSKNEIQAIASTVSYLQRYTLKAAVGVAAGNDDDGAGGAPAKQRPIDQPRANGQGTGDEANGPGDVLEVEELHEVIVMFPTDRDQMISTSQQGRLYNFASKAGWERGQVDDEVARVLSMPTSEIPSLGDAYEATVRWFQTHGPTH